jgi:hypothetical protein
LDDESLTAAVAASNGAVAALRPELPPDVWPDGVEFAATLYAARLYRRRGSVEGLAGYQDMGGVPVIRIDPDVQALLGLGPWQPSVVA